MKRINLRKTLGAAALIGGTIVAASALADPPQGAYGHGYGMGAGMMGDYGMGGAGMMGGYGMGPGMMDGPGRGYGTLLVDAPLLPFDNQTTPLR